MRCDILTCRDHPPPTVFTCFCFFMPSLHPYYFCRKFSKYSIDYIIQYRLHHRVNPPYHHLELCTVFRTLSNSSVKLKAIGVFSPSLLSFSPHLPSPPLSFSLPSPPLPSPSLPLPSPPLSFSLPSPPLPSPSLLLPCLVPRTTP